MMKIVVSRQPYNIVNRVLSSRQAVTKLIIFPIDDGVGAGLAPALSLHLSEGNRKGCPYNILYASRQIPIP